jgi:hypothetical protein
MMFKIFLMSKDKLCWNEEIGGCVPTKEGSTFKTAKQAGEVVDRLSYEYDTCEYDFSIVPA